MISDELRDFVNEWRLGDLATVGPDGPNVSPKGTFQVVDQRRLAFAEIRSPNTMRNLAHDNRVDVSMVDVFARKGSRFRGRATFHATDSDQAAALRPHWDDVFGRELMDRASGFVLIEVDTVRPLTTPAYDVGAIERQLREDYRVRFNAMQEAWLMARDAK